MGYIDYSIEPQSDIAFLDMKSFYASVECVDRGLHPLYTSLCVMSRADNSAGLILASSPMFKKVFGKANVGRFKTMLLQMTFSPIQSMKALLTLLAHFLTLFLISQCQGKIS